MPTCQKKKEAFVHVLGKGLDFKKDSPMMKAMCDLEYDFTKDIVTMDKEEVMRLLYKVTKEDRSIEVTKDVPMKLKKKLLHVLWWCNQKVLLRANKIAVNMARTAIKMDPDAAFTITVKQFNDSQRGHKRNLRVFKYFNGDHRMWFMCQRNWNSNAVNDGIKHLMESSYTVPLDETEAKE
eukprot:5727779-Ditylum_brightwellii.AAC.1